MTLQLGITLSAFAILAGTMVRLSVGWWRAARDVAAAPEDEKAAA